MAGQLSSIVLQVPRGKNESKESLQSRRLVYQGQFIKEIESMTIIGITTLYLFLGEEEKKRLCSRGRV